MKNLLIIFLVVLFFFGLLFAAYIIAFKSYFSSNKLINTTKHFSRMTFQRDIKTSGMSFSPFGIFKMRSFSMAAKGGFDYGTLISINKVFADVKLIKLIRRELYVNNLSVDGVSLNLNYENKRKFDYESFFSNIKFILMQSGNRVGLVKKAEIKNIAIENVNIDLMLDIGNIKIKNIIFVSNLIESGNNFDVKTSFELEFKNKQYSATANLSYDANQKTINVVELISKKNSLAANGKIYLLENGKITLDFIVNANNDFFSNFLFEIIAADYFEKIESSSGDVKSGKVLYLGESSKQ